MTYPPEDAYPGREAERAYEEWVLQQIERQEQDFNQEENLTLEEYADELQAERPSWREAIRNVFFRGGK